MGGIAVPKIYYKLYAFIFSFMFTFTWRVNVFNVQEPIFFRISVQSRKRSRHWHISFLRISWKYGNEYSHSLGLVASFVLMLCWCPIFQSCNKDFRRFFGRALNMIYYRLGTCINCTLHLSWILYQTAYPKLIGYKMPCELQSVLFTPKVHSYKFIEPVYSSPLLEDSLMQLCHIPMCDHFFTHGKFLYLINLNTTV